MTPDRTPAGFHPDQPATRRDRQVWTAERIRALGAVTPALDLLVEVFGVGLDQRLLRSCHCGLPLLAALQRPVRLHARMLVLRSADLDLAVG